MLLNISILKKIFRFRIIDLFTVIFCIHMLFNSSSSYFLYIALVLFLWWLFLAFIKDRYFLSRYLLDKKNCLLIAVSLYGFLCGVLGGDSLFSLKQFLAFFLLYSPIIIFDFYKKEENRFYLFFVITWVMLFWIICSIMAISFFNANPGAAKYLAMDSTTYGTIAIGGGMALGYGSALLCSLLIDLMFREKKIIRRIFIGIALLILALLLVRTESTVTLVCCAVGIIVSLFRIGNEGTTKSKMMLSVLLIIMFAAIVLCSKDFIGQTIIDIGIAQQSTFGQRIVSLGYVLKGDAVSGSYAYDRAAIALTSINTFLSHPILGVAHMHGNGFYHVAEYGVGNHSAWFDMYANYGIIFGSCYLFMYICQIKEIMKSDKKIFSSGWLACLILLGCFNPIKAWHPNFILFFVIPAFSIMMKNED